MARVPVTESLGFYDALHNRLAMTEPAASTAPTVFFVSDGTGVTAETLGHSVMAQFEKLKYRQQRMPFVDSVHKVHDVLQRIDEARVRDGRRPIVFSTLVNPEINRELRKANALLLDLFESFVEPLENELGVKSTESESYKHRIEAINFSLAHDDGQSTMSLQAADVILVGVSRSGKTPTSLYLAMQFGIKAANYPLIPDDFERSELPSALPPLKAKLFGLSIAPERLAEIRHERRPNSRYASLENCRYEVAAAEQLMRREGVRWLSSTTKSIEEIAATILQEVKLERRDY